MKPVYFIGWTAITFWMNHPQLQPDKMEQLHAQTLEKRCMRADKVKKIALELDCMTEQLEILVPSSHYHKIKSDFRYFSTIKEIPKGAFIRIKDDVYVASPEYAFMQVGHRMNMTDRTLFGDELCGYIIDGNPLSSVEQLKKFCHRAKNRKGVARLRKIVNFVHNNSASPEESIISALLSFPMKYGGYGYSNFEMNSIVQLNSSQSSICNSRFIKPDFLIKKVNIIMEYDSRTWHNSRETMLHDKIKRMVYKDLGYSVITLYPKDIKSINRFHEIALTLCNATRKRLSYPHFFNERRQNLRRHLFAYHSISCA